jgi:hypothetical protein
LYHITDDGPRRCKAVVGKCPYGKTSGNHFDNQVDAQKEYESRLVSQYGTMGASVANKVNFSPLQQKYREQDRLKATSPSYRAWATYRDLKKYTPKQSESRTGGGSRQSSAHRSKLNRLGKRFIKKNLRKLVRATTPNSSNMKKLLLVKYWMPNIHSNKWR